MDDVSESARRALFDNDFLCIENYSSDNIKYPVHFSKEDALPLIVFLFMTVSLTDL